MLALLLAGLLLQGRRLGPWERGELGEEGDSGSDNWSGKAGGSPAG